jgi:hypothetical protein
MKSLVNSSELTYLQQVGLAQAGVAVDEQRVVGLRGSLGDGDRRGVREPVARADDEGLEGVLRVQPGLARPRDLRAHDMGRGRLAGRRQAGGTGSRGMTDPVYLPGPLGDDVRAVMVHGRERGVAVARVASRPARSRLDRDGVAVGGGPGGLPWTGGNAGNGRDGAGDRVVGVVRLGGRVADVGGRGRIDRDRELDVAGQFPGQRVGDEGAQPGLELLLDKIIRRGDQGGVLDQAKRPGELQPGTLMRLNLHAGEVCK